MAFPNNPSNGDTFVRYGRTYQYDSTMLMWKVPKSGILLGELADIDVTTNPPIVGDALRWSGSKFEPETVNTVTVYQTDLPLSGNSAGDMAYITDLSSLYIYTGAGWFNVAIINTNPTITVGPDGGYAFATDGTPIVLTLEAQDPEGLPITWAYSVTSGVLGSTATVSQADNVFTITPSTNRENAGQFSITFTASDGVNIATSVSAFTLVFGTADQYYNNNSLLVKSGSTAGLNNTTFVDGSTNGLTVTPTGDVYQGSLSPYSPAGWSAYFDGTGDFLSLSSSTDFGLVEQDWTVECYAYIEGLTNSYGRLWYLEGDSSLNIDGIYFSNTHMSMGTTGVWSVGDGTGGEYSQNKWIHIAVCHDSTNMRMYIDGVQTLTTSNNFYNSSSKKITLMSTNNGSHGGLGKGFISNFRIVKGTAVYTSNFTPPTQSLTAVSGTSLLTCQSNRFIDNSTNNFTITKYGDTKAVPFSPYLPSVQYDPTIHGGSAYFDGSNDYLDIPGNAAAFGTSDYTVEGWHYYTGAAATNTRFLIDCRFGGGSNLLLFFESATYKLYINGHVANGGTLVKDAWQHFALVRSSGSTKLYVNGTSVFTWADSTNYVSTQVRLGRDVNNNDSLSWVGYMSDIRIVKGTALYTSNFAPPTEPLTAISGTSLLLNMNNAGIYDEMSKNNIQVIGNTTTSTTQTKYSDTSVYFDGTGDYVTSSTTAGVMGTGNFTIETWFYPTTSGTNRCIINTRTADGSTTGFYLGLTSLQYAMFYVPGGGSITTPQNSILADSWYHIAVVRNANIVNLYLNGVSVGSSTIGSNFTDTLFQIGGCPNVSGSSANYFSGYLEDVRITKGVARYTANFTPPTAALGFDNAD